MYNKVYKLIKKGGIYMTELIRITIKDMLCGTLLLPKTDYQRHVPKSATELSESNWKKTGDSLRRAIKKVRDEDGQEF